MRSKIAATLRSRCGVESQLARASHRKKAMKDVNTEGSATMAARPPWKGAVIASSGPTNEVS